MNHKSENQPYLQRAMDWLCHAQDISRDGGVAGWLSFIKGWSPSYPETTGYIIPTFFDYARTVSDPESYRLRAFRMADWLLTCQMENGAFPGHHIKVTPEPRIFNTGQIILGLIRTFEESKDSKYLDSARRAGDFCIESLDADGAWRRHAYRGVPHTYYTRVAWSLLEIWQVTKEEKYTEAAMRNLDWTLSQQDTNGWFHHAAFDQKQNPYMHTIAYLLSGLLESSIILHDQKYLDPVADIAGRLLRKYEIRKFMPGEVDSEGKGNFTYTCLTGDAQMSILWAQLYRAVGDARFLNGALKINDYLKAKQLNDIPFKALHGGLTGSDPVWGAYHPFWIPSWAVKFFADALMLEDEIMHGLYVNVENEYHNISRT